MEHYTVSVDPKPMTRLWHIRRWLAVKLYPPLPWAHTTTDGKVEIKMPAFGNNVTMATIDCSGITRDAWL